jgi:hypothetical protein
MTTKIFAAVAALVAVQKQPTTHPTLKAAAA